MALSLASFASYLNTFEFEKFRKTKKIFKTEDMPLVTRKGVYPYEYTESWDNLEEDVLPRKEGFYSTLTEKNIDDDEYRHAKTVSCHFDCRTLGEYSDLYLKIDVLLLADVFENFRDDDLPDSVSRIRDGSVQASKRYGKANNYTVEDYDKTKENAWIIYQDCKNLYGWAMYVWYMSHGCFKWIEPTLNGINDLDDISPIGRVYEVDIEYSEHLHEDHNNLPFLPNNGFPPGSKSPWLKKYIDLNTEMRKKAANDFEKDFYKLMNNAVFGKTMESLRLKINIELVSNE
ncbi:Ribonuclease H-like domain,DNA polymerase, palm domain [Cinara cedri]|uniref:Ribonuclease H-like domain,DNA polymerase, palm domain n=1 Tax=Cinara cedri TaxID=506608 RepID=A0A5E4NJ93_9HEMI|nr:Ribonuclease H-like domain,DNA polymerase, palm domain [Cinara cedri]